jgi:uncharacterized membrane protein YbhN (UPF0104 family)
VSERHPRLAAVLGFLRRHWLESIAVLSLVGLVVAVNPLRLAGALGRTRPAELALMLPVVLLVYGFRGLGWWVALRHVGVRISPFRSVYLMYAGQALIFMPTGDLARVALVERTGASGRGEGTLAGTIAFQELVYLGLVGLGVLPRVALHPDIAILVVLMTAAHAGIFVLILWERAYRWAVDVVTRIRLFGRFKPKLESLRPAFVEMMRPWNLAGVLVFNALAVGFLYLLFYLALRAVGITSLTFTEATFAYGLAHILSGLSFLPAGVGSQEAIVTGLLATHGVPVSTGAAASLVFRGFNDVVMAVVGALCGLLVRRATSEREARKDELRRPAPDRG